jgi:murein DD-endopeptidase MepM/ murein hydrolase activator NlpD
LISTLGLLLAAGAHSAAQDVRLPRLSFAPVNWSEAIASLPNVEAQPTAVLSSRQRRAGVSRAASPRLAQINGIMSQVFAGLPSSPVPVLLPFDVGALIQDQASGAAGPIDRYFSGFNAARFFYPGPAGYDAAFVIRTSDVPELADVKSSQPIEVQISGSALLYELDGSIGGDGQPVPALEGEFPGIRRTVIEHHLRYTFVKFGVPYVVSALCFDASVSRYRMPTCRAADQVAQRFLRALRVVGGKPRALRATAQLPIERPTQVSRTFGYFVPGQLISGSGGGRADFTAYSQIRFPLETAPAYAISQVYARRDRVKAAELDENGPTAAIWHDNFCERRGFPVAQCPAGIGHQGQDIRSAPCKPLPGADRCTHRGNIVAVRDGVILRSPRQEAAYLFVNSANEHIRFRYLHMNPRKMDSDGLLSGRRVHEGEIIGEVSNFSMKEAGTSYHLHFDIQVPTRRGWVFVNPYMTLVTAYERLIGERGAELFDPGAVASADTNDGSSIITSGWCFTNPASCSRTSRMLRTVRAEPEASGHAKEVPPPEAKEGVPEHAKEEVQPHHEDAQSTESETTDSIKPTSAKNKSAKSRSHKSKSARSKSARSKSARSKPARSAKSRHRQHVAHRD